MKEQQENQISLDTEELLCEIEQPKKGRTQKYCVFST